jgi:hypothetical protein
MCGQIKILTLFDLKFSIKPWARLSGDYLTGPQILPIVFHQPVGWDFRCLPHRLSQLSAVITLIFFEHI